MKSINIRSFAKVNIALDVLDKRPDGYHNIESVVQTISLHDCVTIARRDDGQISVRTSDPAVPSGEGNLAYRACVMFLEAAGQSVGVDIMIEKAIPMQAGLGGGSSNAAAAVRGLNDLFGRPLDEAGLHRICAGVGSDAPLFLVGGTVFVSGRGEIVEPLPNVLLDYVIVKPDVGVSTAWAYGSLELRVESLERPHPSPLLKGEGGFSPSPQPSPKGEGDSAPQAPASAAGYRSNGRRFASRAVAEAVRGGNRQDVVRNMRNDFQEVVEAEFAEIAEIRGEMAGLGAENAMLAGSGSAVFGVFMDAGVCDAAYEVLKGKYQRVYRAISVQNLTADERR
ncbi:MAG: 4-(cytidine 5'-diphospho)-2-C-methyl-D-erythritol kinase [Armatimonadota bacterium]|nr:4-(cytidine 5'-diphospho)-2-C-methyl-D-erythritol kinase [Armatimonadota bacterium]